MGKKRVKVYEGGQLSLPFNECPEENECECAEHSAIASTNLICIENFRSKQASVDCRQRKLAVELLIQFAEQKAW